MRTNLFCLVDIDPISESSSSEFNDDDDDAGDVDSDSVISTTSDRDKEAPTSSNVSSLFVHNDGPLAKAWKAANSFCELLLNILIGQNIILTRHVSVWSLQKMISNEVAFLGKLFVHFSAGPDPGYYLNEQNDLGSEEEVQCVDFDNLTDDEASLASKRLPVCPFIDYEAEETGNSHESDDSEVAVSSLKKSKRSKNQFQSSN